MARYMCRMCDSDSCFIELFGNDCTPILCPFVPRDRKYLRDAKWERDAGQEESSDTDNQHLKSEIAAVRKYIEDMREAKMSSESILNHVDGTLRQLSAV